MAGGKERKKKGGSKTVTGRRAYRERKRTGNRTKGLRNKEWVRSVQRDQEGKKEQQWARGQRQRKRKKGQGARQRRRERKKGRASWTGRYSKKRLDRQRDREINTETNGQAAGKKNKDRKDRAGSRTKRQ